MNKTDLLEQLEDKDKLIEFMTAQLESKFTLKGLVRKYLLAASIPALWLLPFFLSWLHGSNDVFARSEEAAVRFVIGLLFAMTPLAAAIVKLYEDKK